MAITPYTNIGRIEWLRDDPVALAKAQRSQRQAAAMGQLGGGIKRGVSNYMKGGVRGMIDPEYAEEQKKARMENAELDARLAGQEADAADQSQQPSQTGTPPLEPVIKPGEERSWLSQLGDTRVGGVARKVWQGPSGPSVNLQELAAKRGRAKSYEDRIKLVDAASRAIQYADDPGAAVAGIIGKGIPALRGIKPKPMEPSGGDKDSFYVQEYNDSKDQGRPFDMGRVIAAREAAHRKRTREDAEIKEEFEDPPQPRAKSGMEEARALAEQEYGPNPTMKQILKIYRGMNRGATRGGGSKAPVHEAIRGEKEAAAKDMARLVGADPRDWQHFIGVTDVKKAKMKKVDLEVMHAREPKVPPPATPPVPQPHGEVAAPSGPDSAPKQPDGRVGPTGNTGPKRYDGKPDPSDDVSIFEEP
jgi:hypothetical protein